MSVIWSGITEEGAVVPVQVTEEGKVVAVGDGPQGDYLPITGGNLTGDLTVDTDKIELNSDGSASFSGNISLSDWYMVTAKTNPGTGFIVNGTEKIAGISNGNAANPVSIDCIADGKIIIHQSNRIEPSITFNADGSAFFAGKIFARGGELTTTVENTFQLRTVYNNNCNFTVTNRAAYFGGSQAFSGAGSSAQINSDGSASFSGGKCGFTADGELIFSSRGTRYKLFVSQGVCQAEEYTRQMELKEKAEQLIADKRETKPSEPGVTPDNDNA